MAVVRIIICILALLAFGVSGKNLDRRNKLTRVSKISLFIGTILAITFCILLIVTNWNIFTIPNILLFVFGCIIFGTIEIPDNNSRVKIVYIVSVIVVIIAYIVTLGIYIINLKECENPDVTITKRTILCTNDDYPVTGTISGGIIVKGKISEESVYRYYYELEDGGIKQGSIPADSTTIYYIKSGEEPYFEKIITTTYYTDGSKDPTKRVLEHSETTYKLYVPRGSIANFEFNAE